MPVVKLDMKALQVPGSFVKDSFDQLLRRDSLCFRLEHDWSSVRVVGADEMHFVALHPLEAHPDVGLDVLHDVADVERAVGVGQSGGGEDSARHRCVEELKGWDSNKHVKPTVCASLR